MAPALTRIRKRVAGERLVRRHGIERSGEVRVAGPPPLITGEGTIRVGRDLVIENAQLRVALGAHGDGVLEIGDHVLVNNGADIQARRRIAIGDHAKIGPLVAIYDSPWHELDAATPADPAPVVVGANVWLARGATVLRGVTIGDGAVVAAGSVVTADVPPATLVAGAPARVVRALDCPPGWIRA